MMRSFFFTNSGYNYPINILMASSRHETNPQPVQSGPIRFAWRRREVQSPDIPTVAPPLSGGDGRAPPETKAPSPAPAGSREPAPLSARGPADYGYHDYQTAAAAVSWRVDHQNYASLSHCRSSAFGRPQSRTHRMSDVFRRT